MGRKTMICNKKCKTCNDCELKAIAMMRADGIEVIECIVEYKDGTRSNVMFTREEMNQNLRGYPTNERYKGTTGYYKIIGVVENDFNEQTYI